MRFESSVTSVSWIPSEAMTGPMRLPMDIGVGNYDHPPPDEVEDFAKLVEDDSCRFANRLSAWIEVEDGAIVDHGYNGAGMVSSTTLRLGLGSLSVPGVGFPILQSEPKVVDSVAHFTQTAGGRTGAPLPRRTSRPPYLRITAPTAWTTLSLSIAADGDATGHMTGASPFPRHWIYGDDGSLMAKSGVIDFKEWTRHHSHDNTPWSQFDRTAVIADIESELERKLSRRAMSGRKPKFLSIIAGDALVQQGEEGIDLFLVLDGMLSVDVDGEIVAEVGPGALLGERAILEVGIRTSTLKAITLTRVATLDPDLFTGEELSEVADQHRRETD